MAGSSVGLQIRRSCPEKSSVSMGIGVSGFNGKGSYFPSNDKTLDWRVGIIIIFFRRALLLLLLLFVLVVTIGGIMSGIDMLRFI